MDENLLILAADHRTTLKSDILGIKKELNRKQLETIHDFKAMILEAFNLAIKNGLNKSDCALLLDEDFGEIQLKEAKENGVKIIIPVEKSGQKIFDFNYGRNFIQHIEKFHPDYVKVLLHFNPANTEHNKKSLKNLRIISNYLKTTNYKFLLEVLINPTEEQLKQYGRKGFDIKLRPLLTVKTIKQLHKAGIYPHIWKLEGGDRKQDINMVSSIVDYAKIVILGRSESMAKVLKWIGIAAKNKKVIGFAVGRTIFMKALQDFYSKKITREKAIKIMASRYYKICKFYLENSKHKEIV
ncbi:DUF2090 domain-containing protein [Candidatus Woesearchaeota archaeon]|nr:DUF2090 domain-containing protein [Candidatus Woesearchaeota archaeon]